MRSPGTRNEVPDVKNLIAFVLGLLLLAAGAGAMVFQQQSLAEEFEFQQLLANIHRETARQTALVARSPEDKFNYDRQQLVRRHVEAVDGLRKRFPEKLRPDAFIEDMEAKAREGAKDKAKTAEYRARYDYVKEMWETYMKSGSFKPLFSGESNGVRFEVVNIKKSNEGGSEGLRWDVFLYGAPPKDQLQLTNLHVENWVEFPEMETAGKRKGQPKRAMYKGDYAPFLPYVFVDKPWEWFPEWPTGVMVGYYVGLPLWDSRTTVSNLALDGALRTFGGTILPLKMEWKRKAIDAAWKGVAGGKADDPALQPLSDEDLKEQGVVLPEEEDEAAKKKADDAGR
jgi:hypothetical protein